MDDSERTYGYSDDIYHGQRGPGGHYRAEYRRTDSPRFYPDQPHHERSYEYADRFGQGFPRHDEVTPEGAAVRERGQGQPAVPRGGTAPSFRRDHYRPGESWTWDLDGPHQGRGPKGYRRSDDRIHEDVCERLQAHGRIDASEIEVTVEDGEVTLQGTVDDRRTKRLAEAVTDTVRGVHDVHNRLRLEGRKRQDREVSEEPVS